MTTPPSDDALRYPLGRLSIRSESTAEERAAWREAIASTPRRLRAAVNGLDPEQLDTPYRPGGWTVRQVVHHLPDSHMNALTRFKLALTEEVPTIRPYDEAGWARLADGVSEAIDNSLTLLDGLHTRLLLVIDSMGPDELRRELVHPESGRMDVHALLQTYAWHGPHHVAHITGLRERMGW